MVIWLTGTITTNIYHIGGNVTIGTINTSVDDDNTNFIMPTALLYVRGQPTTNPGFVM